MTFKQIGEGFMGVPGSLTPAVGYEGLYSVSADGRIWAHPKSSRLKGRWLKQSVMRTGYRYVCLFKEGQRKNVYVHRLVAIAFLGSRPGMQVNHINGIKADNTLQNLEWCTPKENKQHAWRSGITSLDVHKSSILTAARTLLRRGPQGRYVKNQNA